MPQSLRKALTFEEAWAAVVKAAGDPFLLRGQYTKSQHRRIEEAKECLKDAVESGRRNKYFKFLLPVLLYRNGEVLGLIVVLSLAQKVVDMTNPNRDLLEKNLKELGQGFDHLETWKILAQQSGVCAPQVVTSAASSSASSSLQASVIESNHTDIATAQQWSFQSAPLPGIEKAFSKYLCDAIRKVSVNGEVRASVTLVFPVWTTSRDSVQCLMSLDVCEQTVIQQVAMKLFGAKLQWVGDVLHIVLNNGITLMVANPEITLKGVLDGAIREVFGDEIDAAVNDCPVRQRERLEGKEVTECGSMIVMKHGAILNLSLNLLGGLNMKDKLYG